MRSVNGAVLMALSCIVTLARLCCRRHSSLRFSTLDRRSETLAWP